MRTTERSTRGEQHTARDRADAPTVAEGSRTDGDRIAGGRRAARIRGVDQLLAVQATQGNRRALGLVQRRRGSAGPGAETATQIHAGAQQGTRGPGGSLPHLARIQRSFGRHDVSTIRAHTDRHAAEGARAMGAIAFATGDHVAFAGTPSLHTAAHEAAHVIQQRGGVALKRDVGDVGDVHERHADAVAELVTRGQSAEALLDTYQAAGTAGAGGDVVQRKVGFEFEAQWNVRERATEEENALAKKAFTDARDAKIAERVAQIDTKELLDAAEALKMEFATNKRDVEAYEELSSFEKLKVKVSGGAPRRLPEDYVTRKLIELNAQMQDPARKARVRLTAEIQLIMQKMIPEATFLPGKNLSKLGTVVSGDGFDLTADTSPSGGAQLEWVVFPPCETEEDVVAVMDDITAQAQYLDDRSDQESIDATELNGVGSGADAKDVVIYPQGEKLAIAPQVTGGFRLDRLDALLDYLAGNQATGSRDAKVDLLNTVQATTEVDVLERTGTKTRALVEALRTSLPATEDRDEARAIAELVGLVRMMSNYLALGNKLGPDANSKSIAGRFMARTDFCYNFKLLAPEYQAYLGKNIDVFTSLVLEAAGLADTGGTKVFPRGFEKGLSGQRVRYDFPLTRAGWIAGIPLGYDGLRNYDKLLKPSDDKKNPVHVSLGGLGSVDDKVGPDDAFSAMVIELRGMADNRKVAELKKLAIATFRLIESVNSGGDILYDKDPVL